MINKIKFPINPNLITTLRLPIAPLAVYALVSEYYIIAAVLALILEVTDVADGHIARKYDCVTTFGKLYDPFSDAFSRYTLVKGPRYATTPAPMSTSPSSRV